MPTSRSLAFVFKTLSLYKSYVIAGPVVPALSSRATNYDHTKHTYKA